MRSNTKKLVYMALLVALEVVLSRVLSINTPINKVGFAFVPLALSGMIFGPLGGLAVGTAADLLGATLLPNGPFFPGFTLTTALKGLVYGLCLHHKDTGPRWPSILFAVTFNAVVFSLCLNTLWIYLMYHGDPLVLLGSRVVQELFLIPVQAVILRAITASPLRRVWSDL